MNREELKLRLRHACDHVIAAEEILTDIDTRFGDADHGITMTKICRGIKEAVESSEGGIREILEDAAGSVLELSGGSAVPLWNAWLDAMQEAAPDGDEVDIPGLKKMFASAFEEFSDFSGAEVGDKTMMDALAPASAAIADYKGSREEELFRAAAEAAVRGAEETRNLTAKYGRAKSYGTKTIGTPDAGAKSMSCFFEGLAE